MLRAEEIVRRLQPLIQGRADQIWQTYLASDPDERKLIQQSLEILHSESVQDYKDDRITLVPPMKFEELHGEYPVGMVQYTDRPLYPFAFQEVELGSHLGVFGRTGVGKSYFVRGLLLSVLRYRRPFLVLDWKSTHHELAGLPGSDVLVLTPGTASLPFLFNPLNLTGVDPEQQKTYLRQVIEIFIGTFLEDLQLLTVQGVEYLLLIALDSLQAQKADLTFQKLYDWILDFKGSMRERDWRTSALDLLYKLVTGPLGTVMTSKSWPIESLLNKRIVLELSNVGNSKDRSFLVKTLFLRLYYHFSALGKSDSVRLILVIEEAHNVLLRPKGGYETIIDVVLRQIREYGVSVIIVDQHPSLMTLPALGTSATVCFNLRSHEDRAAMASALLLEPGQMKYLGQLPPRQAIVKTQRTPTPFLIKSFFVPRTTPPSTQELRQRAQKQLPDLGQESPQQQLESASVGESGCQDGFEVVRDVSSQSRFVRVVRDVSRVWSRYILYTSVQVHGLQFRPFWEHLSGGVSYALERNVSHGRTNAIPHRLPRGLLLLHRTVWPIRHQPTDRIQMGAALCRRGRCGVDGEIT